VLNLEKIATRIQTDTHSTFAALSLNPASLLLTWKKGLGDEGKFTKARMYSIHPLPIDGYPENPYTFCQFWQWTSIC